MSIEGLRYEDEVVRLSDLFTTSPELSNLVFENCLLVGPAVIAFLGKCNVAGNHFNGRPEAIFLEVEGEREVIGVLGLRNVTISNSRLENIGIAGDRALMQKFGYQGRS
jgi:hypothetical protein